MQTMLLRSGCLLLTFTTRIQRLKFEIMVKGRRHYVRFGEDTDTLMAK